MSLAVERDAAGGRTSRHRLAPPVDTPVGPPAPPVPLEALELRFLEPFFSRPARLLGRAGSGGRERPIWQGTLAQRGDTPAPVLVPLDGAARRELWLEVDEGDDRPLTPLRADGLVRVPRLTFKAAPGPHRLLLGHDEAQAPRYDLALLAREALAWSALAVSPGALGDNPAFRRTGAEYLRQAPPTLVLWGVLLLAVAALLLMTARLLRSGAPRGGRGGLRCSDPRGTGTTWTSRGRWPRAPTAGGGGWGP